MMLSLVSTLLKASTPLLPLLLLKSSQLQAETLQASTDHAASSLGRTRGLETQLRELKQDPALGGSGKLHHHLGKANLLLAPLLPC